MHSIVCQAITEATKNISLPVAVKTISEIMALFLNMSNKTMFFTSKL